MRVPHLSVLGLRQEFLQELYDKRIQPPSTQQKCVSLSEVSKQPSVYEQMDWSHAWNEYVRGNVVSQTAADLI